MGNKKKKLQRKKRAKKVYLLYKYSRREIRSVRRAASRDARERSLYRAEHRADI